MVSQQLINGHMTITTIAKYSITTICSFNAPKFETYVDAYDQFIYMSKEKQMEYTPHFDHYGQLVCIT
ncbi:hypothetical protein [Desulforamulus reducens]|uniref:hypothetical protein n=1 Tax=Desulforamulus reducens TaxID=59610 RepID=UPI00059B7C67|nr:hypothetical protein [Desulforamulus reducens]